MNLNIIPSVFNKLFRFFYKIKTMVYYTIFFNKIGRNCVIYKPILLSGLHYISLGNNVFIRDNSRIEVIKQGDLLPKLCIGDNVNIEQNVHIVCGSFIKIGSNVSITANTAIVDINHPYEDMTSNLKIGDRLEFEGNYVEIGDGSFIGIGCIILPNVRIGRNVVIGAHSVVNVDIPDYSVAVGNPVKIIKRYDSISEKWNKV